MKYIKKFENKEYQGSYWKVRIDEPYFSESLEYLSTYIHPIRPKGRFDFLKILNSIKKSGYAFIIFNNNDWEWVEIKDEDFLKDSKYRYMGSTEDIDIVDLQIQSKKYNL